MFKIIHSIQRNPDGLTSNFFVHSSFDPKEDFEQLQIDCFLTKEIPKKNSEFAGLVLGEYDELVSIQKQLVANGWNHQD